MPFWPVRLVAQQRSCRAGSLGAARIADAALPLEWKGPGVTTDAVRGLVDLAGVVTGAGVDRAKDAVRTLLTVALEVLDNPGAATARFGDAAREHVNDAGESLDTAAEDMSERIRAEVDRVAARFGFVREEELAAVRARVQRLEAQLVEISRTGAAGAKESAPTSSAKPRSGGRSSASGRPAGSKASKAKAPATKQRPPKPGAAKPGRTDSPAATRRGTRA